jgi:hypothetical protein
LVETIDNTRKVCDESLLLGRRSWYRNGRLAYELGRITNSWICIVVLSRTDESCVRIHGPAIETAEQRQNQTQFHLRLNWRDLVYRTLFLAFLFAIFSCGCGKSYVPKEMSAEDAAIKNEYSKYSDQLRRAMGESGDYVQIAVVDRATSFPEDDNEYSRVLVLHREQLDLDDYGFSPVGKERSEADEDYLDGFFNDVMFWTSAAGEITIDDSHTEA